MKPPNPKKKLFRSLSYIVLFISVFLVSCSSNDLPEVLSNGDEQSDCQNPSDFIFEEENGIVSVEFESGNFSGEWSEMSDEPNFSGIGYRVWTGNQYLNEPGNGLGTFVLNIKNPGTYRFLWNSAVTIGNSGTDHNDTWLRFNDADDFYGKKGDNVIYPNGTGKTPNPNGSSTEGWFKIFRSGNDLSFKWESRTSDNDGHQIYVKFDSPGTYTMEISARSSGHAIDRFVLFNESIHSSGDATSDNTEISTISCN